MKVFTLPRLKALRALREGVDVFQEKNTRRTRRCSLKPSLQCPLGFRVSVPYHIIAVDLTMHQRQTSHRGKRLLTSNTCMPSRCATQLAVVDLPTPLGPSNSIESCRW